MKAVIPLIFRCKFVKQPNIEFMFRLFPKFVRFAGAIILLIVLVMSCTKNSDEEQFDKLVSYDSYKQYELNTIETSLGYQTILYPELAGIIAHAESGVEVFKVKYKTEYGDSVVVASGIMCLPMEPGSYPVISFQNGTNTLNADAPSLDPEDEVFKLLEFVSSNGYILLMPDYIGFGSTSDIVHPYFDKESTVHAVTDLIDAFRELSSSGKIQATGNGTLYLVGYSQGGGATMSVFEALENSNILDLTINAVSCGAGAYDLTNMATYVFNQTTYPSPLYFPYFIYGQSQLGNITGNLGLFFSEPYASAIPGLFDGLHSSGSINESLSENISELFTSQLRTNFTSHADFEELRLALTHNSIIGWNTDTKLRLYHGTGDLIVPKQQSVDMYDRFIDAGSDPSQIELILLDGLTHGSALIPWGIETVNWLNTLEGK